MSDNRNEKWHSLWTRHYPSTPSSSGSKASFFWRCWERCAMAQIALKAATEAEWLSGNHLKIPFYRWEDQGPARLVTLWDDEKQV